MAGKRKQRVSTADSPRQRPATASPQHPAVTFAAPRASGDAPPWWETPQQADPPRRHRTLLTITGAGVALWLAFLLYMAFRG